MNAHVLEAFSKATPARDDYRPEIHDSDGLYVATGKGERIWRPLDNPSALGGSAFQDSNPRGFGLMQRERDFERYLASHCQVVLRAVDSGTGAGQAQLACEVDLLRSRAELLKLIAPEQLKAKE